MVFVHALGTAQIDAGGVRVTPTSVRRFSMLLYLAGEPGRRISRSTLHELICPEQSEKNARHTIREILYKLRQAGVPFVSDFSGVELPEEAIRSDYRELLDCVGPREEQIRAAGGGFLPGYAPNHSEAFSEWYDAFRARTGFELCKSVLREMVRAKGLADWVATERAARACLALEPFNEEATLALAEVLTIAGSKAQAVKLLDEYSREVGGSAGLHLPATTLKRRIAERLPKTYGGQSDAPFLGRTSELGYLMERFGLSRDGLSQCVLTIGEPGIGKTRLVGEFAILATLQGAEVHSAKVQPHDTNRPLSAFIDLLPSLLNAPGALGCSPRSLSQLKRLCSSVTQPSDEAATRPSEEAFHENLSAIIELIDSLSNEAPLVLAIDDIHWLDPMSLSLVAHIASERLPRKLLVSITSRPSDKLPALFQHSDQTSFLRLEPLDGDILSKLVATQMSQLGIQDDEASRWICDASNGNPLFAFMLVSHFNEKRTRFDAPPTLRSLLAARVQQLGDSARSLLCLACLLGRHCSLARLTSAADVPSLSLMTTLSELERAHLLRVCDAELRGPHALVVDAALASASNLSIVAGHRRVAQLLEAEAGSEATPSNRWDAADHWIAAGEIDKGVDLLRRCAEDADAIGRPREAAEVLLRASSISRPESRESILIEAMRAAAKSAEHDVVIRVADSLYAEGWVPGHDELELAELTARAVWRDDPTTGERLVACIEDPSTNDEHRNAAALALLRFANSSRDQELSNRAWQFLAPIVQDPNGPPLFRLTASLLYHVCFGDYHELSRLAAEAITVSAAMPPHSAAQLTWLAGLAWMRGGETDKAFAIWRNAYELARSSGLARRQFEIAHLARSFATDAELRPETAEWTARVESLYAAFPDFRDNVYQLSFESDIAAAQQSLAGLQQCYRHARRIFGNHSTGRVTRWMRAVELNIELLRGRRINTRDAITALTEHQRLRFECGDSSDIEIATAIRIAIAAHEPEVARSVLRRYLLEYRQNLSPLWSCLTEAIRNAGLADEARVLLETVKTSPVPMSAGAITSVA